MYLRGISPQIVHPQHFEDVNSIKENPSNLLEGFSFPAMAIIIFSFAYLFQIRTLEYAKTVSV